MMNNPLLDNDFLSSLMSNKQREVFARITRLDINELPIEYIEGRVTGGSINVDGTSALRRTCNLTMVLLDDLEVNMFEWTFETKFKLEIGVKNKINSNYPEIIWFKQGTFILTTCNMSSSTNNYTITINGKDKMCLLNGDLSGNLGASVDFATEEFLDTVTGDVTYTKVLLKNIIYNIVSIYGGELPENIIINDLDEAGLELLEYREDKETLYLFRDATSGMVKQATINPEHKIVIASNSEIVNISEGKKPDEDVNPTEPAKFIYADTSNLINPVEQATLVKMDVNHDEQYHIIKFEYGDLAGYRLTELTYAGELKANVGETLVSVLDKIKNMLGNFEYFYNLDGRFVFQKKSNYISTPWGGAEINSEDIISKAINDSFPKINLKDAQLTTALANNPNLLNVKNDFSVWGTYKSIDGADIPIHMRYALDTKPTLYTSLGGITYGSTGESTEKSYKGYGAPENPNWKLYSYQHAAKIVKTSRGFKTSINAFNKEGKHSWAALYYNVKDLINDDNKTIVVNSTFSLPEDCKFGTVKIGLGYPNSSNANYPSFYTKYSEKDFYESDKYIIFSEVFDTSDLINLNDVYLCVVISPTVEESKDSNLEFFKISKPYYFECIHMDIRKGVSAFDKVDWREIIYQMAMDYYRHGTEDEFYLNVAAANPHYPTGKTGYEQYYTDLQGFWRQLYDPDPEGGFWEVAAEYVATDGVINDGMYVEEYHRPLLRDELYDINDTLYNDRPYEPDELFIIKTIKIKDASGNESEKETFYPFIGSEYCCLEENKEYWYYTGTEYKKTSDSKLLNLKPLDSLYVEDSQGKKRLVIDVAYEKFIQVNYVDDSKPRLWVKEASRKLLTDLRTENAKCDLIYRNGNINNKDYVQYLYNWTVKDNYGNLANDAETTYRITYLQKDPGGDYGSDNWNELVKRSPGQLIFWFDFLDTEGSELYKYSVKKIGSRTKAINDSNVKSIYYREVPHVIFTTKLADSRFEQSSGYTYIQLPPGYQSLFSISSKGKSAKERVDELLQEHSYVIEQTNITTVPLYNLEPNTRVAVQDSNSNIDGEYIVTKVTIPLAYNGTMSLSTNKVISNIM